tara:strand:+ start:308 stop:1471 length:1164 start_codon:yes stop_codon:yes gene_type:complete
MLHPNSITYELSSHIQKVKNNQHVLACDYKRANGSIGKKFTICDDVKTENGLKYFNNLCVVNGYHWYEILLENKPTKIFLDIETSNGVYEKVRQGVELMLKMIKDWLNFKGITLQPNAFHILDSSNDKKISFHVVSKPYLKNLYHVGALVRRLTCFVFNQRYNEAHKNTYNFETLFDNDDNYIVDEQIYTRNRQFRLAGMCKMGSDRVLKGLRPESSFLQCSHVEKEIECLEIDDSIPFSTSMKAQNMFACVDNKWVRITQTSYSSKKMKSNLPPHLSGLRIHLNNYLGGDRITGSTYNIINGTWCLSTSSKRCGIARKTHKSNHIWIVVNSWQRKCYQKCFDEKCYDKQCNIVIPPHFWSKLDQYTKGECTMPNREIYERRMYDDK